MSSGGQWQVQLSSEEFDKIRRDPRLSVLLTLARIVNAMRFCHIAGVQPDKDDPSSKRQRINSFLFQTAVLYEGLKVAKTLGKYFADCESLKAYFIPIFKSETTKRLQETTLKKVRNKMVFHYDKNIPVSMMERLDFVTYTFAVPGGHYPGDVYYGLADEIVINYILGEAKSHKEEEELMEGFIKDTTALSLQFIRAAEQLIAEALKDTGWELITG